MKKIILCLLPVLLLAVVMSGCKMKGHLYSDLSAEDFKKLVDNNVNNPDMTILDVRTPEEYREGHIKNAKNIDFYSPAFKGEIAALDVKKPYLLYCRSGNRSDKAAKIMADMGFNILYNMRNGIIEWTSKGYELVKEEPNAKTGQIRFN